MSAILNLSHAFRALEHRRRNQDERARRNAAFDIDTHDARGDSLLDELATMLHKNHAQILSNFLVGDDLANGVLIRDVIFQVSDAIHAKHPEDIE